MAAVVIIRPCMATWIAAKMANAPCQGIAVKIAALKKARKWIAVKMVNAACPAIPVAIAVKNLKHNL
jgi:hypothetical protein